MKRAVLVTTLAVALAAMWMSRYYRTATLNHAELPLRSIPAPRGWENEYECSKIRRIVSESSAGARRNTMPLSPDEIAVYRALLANWNTGSKTVLNVSNTTEPLDGSDSSKLWNCRCLEGLDVESIVRATHSSHKLTRDVLTQRNMRLVDGSIQMAEVEAKDPANRLGGQESVDELVNRALASGLFSVSEIAFDREHSRALVSYSFVCGDLCGSGGVLVFHKVNGEWKKSALDCGGWIS